MIAFIDLDNFKLINDRFGHNSGDLFLIQVGERLNTLQQNGEVIGRLGGDEFLVVSRTTRIRIFRRCENVFNSKYVENIT